MNKLKKYWPDYTHIDKIWVVDEITYVTKTRFNITFTEMYSLDGKLIWYINYKFKIPYAKRTKDNNGS